MSTHDRPARVAHEFQRELGDGARARAQGPAHHRLHHRDRREDAARPEGDHGLRLDPREDEATREQTLEGLRAAAGYLQREVARRLSLRYTPHLRFAYDESVAEGDRSSGC